MTQHPLSRRRFLAAVSGAAVLAAMPVSAFAQNAPAGIQFSASLVDDLAKKLSKDAYSAEANPVPEVLRDLDANAYNAISFQPSRAFFGDSGSLFRAELYHLGYLYSRAARVNLVTNATAYGIPYSPELFDFGETSLTRLPAETGYAGLRLRYPLNKPDVFDEMLSFLGASNFRPLGRGQRYGLHSRGVAIDTALTSGEEFPYFREFWLETPGANASAIFVHALLDSPSLTGAYHFKITPGEDTTVDISATLFARKNIKKLGLAPLASMFFYGEAQARRGNDFRPEVHNSDGLLMNNGAGEWLWRPLRNPAQLAVSSFVDQNPRGFGLMQRDRDFDHYQDLKALAQQRASYWVEPLGDWGQGTIELAEIPTPDETNDNIIAYWVPAKKMKAGESRNLSYRLHAMTEMVPDRTHPGGRVSASYVQKTTDNSARYLVEFSGGNLAYFLEQPSLVEAVATASNGTVTATSIEVNPSIKGFRVSMDVTRRENRTADLRMFLRARGSAITETWLMPFSP